MNKLLITIATVLLSQTTFARDAAVNAVDVDSQRFAFPIESATLTIDEVQGVAKLRVSFKNPCAQQNPNSMSCRALRPADEIISLPLIAKSEGTCGATIYTAQKANRSLGATVETLIVTDMSTLTCRVLVPADEMTQVQYGWTQRLGHVGSAAELSMNTLQNEHPQVLNNESLFVGVALEEKL